MFAIASHTKTTNRGMPVACFVFGLLGHHGTTAWAQVWLNVVQQAVHDTKTLYPHFQVDFLLTEIGPDIQKPVSATNAKGSGLAVVAILALQMS